MIPNTILCSFSDLSLQDRFVFEYEIRYKEEKDSLLSFISVYQKTSNSEYKEIKMLEDFRKNKTARKCNHKGTVYKNALVYKFTCE